MSWILDHPWENRSMRFLKLGLGREGQKGSNIDGVFPMSFFEEPSNL